MTFEIEKVLVCTTGNLMQATCDAVCEGKIEQLWAMSYEHGALVWAEALEPVQGYPELKAILQLAQKQGCRWVRFDCDAEPLPDMPLWEW